MKTLFSGRYVCNVAVMSRAVAATNWTLNPVSRSSSSRRNRSAGSATATVRTFSTRKSGSALCLSSSARGTSGTTFGSATRGLTRTKGRPYDSASTSVTCSSVRCRISTRISPSSFWWRHRRCSSSADRAAPWLDQPAVDEHLAERFSLQGQRHIRSAARRKWVGCHTYGIGSSLRLPEKKDVIICKKLSGIMGTSLSGVSALDARVRITVRPPPNDGSVGPLAATPRVRDRSGADARHCG